MIEGSIVLPNPKNLEERRIVNSSSRYTELLNLHLTNFSLNGLKLLLIVLMVQHTKQHPKHYMN